MMNYKNKSNPQYSIKQYIKFQSKKMVVIDKYHIKNPNSKNIFLTVKLTNDSQEKLKTPVRLKVTFKNNRISNKAFIVISKITLPFFVELSGFSNKQLIVNETMGEFTGIYEWESTEVIYQHIISYAMKIMKWWSKPFKLVYETN